MENFDLGLNFRFFKNLYAIHFRKILLFLPGKIFNRDVYELDDNSTFVKLMFAFKSQSTSHVYIRNFTLEVKISRLYVFQICILLFLFEKDICS